MAIEPLASAEEVGGTLTQGQIDRAASAIRAACGWHIAPVVTETIIVNSDGSQDLLLPSLRVVDVTAVRIWNESTKTLESVQDWSLRTGWAAGGILHRDGCWPRGYRVIEVDLVHGFDQCPPELLQVLANSVNRQVVQESLAGHSVTFASTSGALFGEADALVPYRLRGRA